MTFALLLQAPNGFGLSNLVFIGAIILVFYFFMIRPQQKKASDQKKFRESLRKGMNIVTIGGLHGKIISIEDDTVWVEVDKAVKLRFDKTAIAMETTNRVNQTT
jgi:preprotein translocase subunit YajC